MQKVSLDIPTLKESHKASNRSDKLAASLLPSDMRDNNPIDLELIQQRTEAPNKRIKKRKTGPVKGAATIMRDYRDRLLNSPRSQRVLDTILEAALDDDHKHQAAAWSLVIDRIIPKSVVSELFEGEVSSKPTVTINIGSAAPVIKDIEIK